MKFCTILNKNKEMTKEKKNRNMQFLYCLWKKPKSYNLMTSVFSIPPKCDRIFT